MAKQAKKTVEKIVKIPDSVTPIPSRAAADILQCSMGHIRWLRRNGKLKSWKLGNRYTMLDLKEVEALAKTAAKARTEGRKLGAPSRGFSPDT